MSTFSRFNARKGHVVELKREFFHNSILENPYAVLKVEIHKVWFDNQPSSNTLVTTIIDPNIINTSAGKYQVNFNIPEDYEANYVYLDVWYYQTSVSSGETIDSSTNFRVYDDFWFVQDGLTNYKYQLFPDIKTFTKGEKRNIVLQIVPLPLYNTDCNLDSLILPITGIEVKIETNKQELILDWTSTITKNLANKAYVSIDTNLPEFRRGVYYYWVKLRLPNSDIIIAQKFAFNII